MDPRWSPLRILVVDDEPLICWSLAETLTACGDRVTDVGTGAAAVRLLADPCDPVDVVLMDYHLPDVRDLDLLSSVRRMSPRSRVILMSAHYTRELAEQALGLGASRVIAKPIDMCDVPALVHVANR